MKKFLLSLIFISFFSYITNSNCSWSERAKYISGCAIGVTTTLLATFTTYASFTINNQINDNGISFIKFFSILSAVSGLITTKICYDKISELTNKES